MATAPILSFRRAISAIESGSPDGNYGELGPVTKTGDRAYGRYQVMGANVGDWTGEVLGKRMTPEQFLADTKAQDAVFDAKFGQSVAQYGNPEDAASVWFTGQPRTAKSLAASDGGMTGAQYVSRFSKNLGVETVAANAPADTFSRLQGIIQQQAQPPAAGKPPQAAPAAPPGPPDTFTRLQGVITQQAAPAAPPPAPAAVPPVAVAPTPAVATAPSVLPPVGSPLPYGAESTAATVAATKPGMDYPAPGPRPRTVADLAAALPTGEDKGGVAAGVLGAINDLPIVGGPLNQAVVGAAALTGSKLFGQNGGSYYQAYNAVKANEDATMAAHPVATAVGGIAGTTAALAPVASIGPVSRLLGVAPEMSAPARVAASTVSGGAISGTDAAVRGQDVGQGIETGALFGAGSVPVGKAVGAAGSRLFGMVKSPLPAAAAGRSILNDVGGAPGTVAKTLAANPELRPMDVDPALQAKALGLVTKPGTPAAAIVNKAVDASASAADPAVRDALDTAFGKVPDVPKYIANLKATTAANAHAAYEPILQNAKPVDVSGVIKSIDDAVTPGVNQVTSPGSALPIGATKQALVDAKALLTNGKETLTDARRLNTIQSQLRVQADTLAASANGQDRLTAQAIYRVRGQINDAINAAAPGFKATQAKYADDKAIEDAYTAGQSFFQVRTSPAGIAQDRPEAVRDYFTSLPKAAQDAYKLGVRTAADQYMGAVGNAALKGEKIIAPQLVRDSLPIVLGPAKAQTLLTALDNQSNIRSTNALLTSGSKTALTLAAQKSTDIREPNLIIPNRTVFGTATDVGTRLLQPAVRAAARGWGNARNVATARAAVDPQAFSDLTAGPMAAAARRAQATKLLTQGATFGTRLFGMSPSGP